MNFKTTVVLLVLLLGAGAYVIYDRTRGNSREDVAVDNKKLFDVANKDDVTSLTIKSADGSEIVLTKAADDKWRMTKPVDAAAEAWQVDSLVSDLINLQSQGVVDPKDKGLDKPKLNVEVSAKGGKLLKFAVGNKTPLGALYIQVLGHKDADVVSADLYDRLSKPANELRDKQLVSVAANDIKQLTIDREGQKLMLQKKGTQWELTEPKKLEADPSTMTDLLSAITGLRAGDWVAKDSPDISKAQFDKPQMTVAFTTSAPATQPSTAKPASQPVWTTVTFGQYEDIRHQKVYAKISDSQAVVKVAATPIETLSVKPIELRDKKVVDLIPEQVSKIAIAMEIPPAPAPAVKPGKKTQVLIERHKEVAAAPAAADKAKPASVPADKAKPASTPSDKAKPAHADAKAPTTRPSKPAAATHPATAPIVKPPTWALLSDPKGEADDEAIRNLLEEFHPLRAGKFLESTPTTKPAANYVVKITTEGPGGTPVVGHEFKLIDPGGDQNVLAEYNGLSFELPRTILTKLEGNFAKKANAGPKTPITPDDFKGPGEK